MNSSVIDLESKFRTQSVEYGLEPSENLDNLKSQIFSLVQELPAKFTEIVAELQQIDKAAQFYNAMAGVNTVEAGWESELGTLRYLIAHGDTSVDAYNARVSGSKEEFVDLERNKYIVYNRFSEAVL